MSRGTSVSPTNIESRIGLRMRIGGRGLDTSKHAAAATTVRANRYRFMVPAEGKRARPGVAGGCRSPLWNPALGGLLPPGALEHRHREKRAQIIVRHPQPGAQQPDHRPEHLVRDVAVEIEQQLEVGARDGDERAGGVGDRVGGALRAVEDGHLAEAGAGLEDGEGFFARAGDGPRDAHLPVGDDEQAVAGLAFLEDVLAHGELLLAAHFRHAGQFAVVQVLEDRRLLQQIHVHADEGMGCRREGQVKPWVTWADLLTALRLPLAAAFPFVHRPAAQLGLVAVAAASDFFDGMLARRLGESRAGAVLDPTADKVFMAVAFVTVARAHLLHPLEIAGVLGRDIVAALGYVGAWLLRHPMTLPARAGGKAVTVLQLLTLVACIVRSPHVRSIAWATTAVGLYAIWDYGRAAARGTPSADRGT